MEKQITLTELRAVFTKDFDTFGKMDPFLEFVADKEKAKTETAKSAGKEPKWKQAIILKFYEDLANILVNGYEEDTTSNDFMGQGKIDTKSLKASGDLEIKILQEDGKQSGTVFCKYVVKTMAPVPLLTVKNVKCDFYKDTQFILKTKPFFAISSNGNAVTTEPKDKGDARQLVWADILRIKIKDGEKITFSVEDKADNNAKIFFYDVFPKQLKTLTGHKVFNVIDNNFEPLGTLQFDYQTQNFVNKEESTKNQDLAKKQSQQLIQLKVESIKGNLNQAADDLYFKIAVGPNLTKTSMLEKAAKDFTMEVKKTIYAQKNENKVTIAAYNEENVGGDTFYGFGQLLLDNLVEGNNTVKMANRRGNHWGDIILNISKKNVVNRQISLTDIKVKLGVSGDIVGESDVYLIGRIGGWSCRTETVQGKEVAFTKHLNFKYSDQKQMLIQVMDEDVTKDDLMYSLDVNLEDFKNDGQMTLPLIPEKYQNDKTKHGTLTFKYKTKNNIYKEKPKQVTSAKKEEPAAKKQDQKKEQPKKEEPKKEELKKQDTKRTESKKDVTKAEQKKKEEPKKQQPKKEEKKKEQPKVQQKKTEKLPSQKKISVAETKKQQKIDPNAEKQLILSEIRGVYLKDFDTFGKMDPFVRFFLGKEDKKTETAHDAGKECSWKTEISFKYYDDTVLKVRSYDEDVTSNDTMGDGQVETKTLKSKGQLEIKIISETKQHVGTIYCKYVLNCLPLVPLLVIRSVKCDFYKDTQFVLKTKPFFSITTNGASVTTEAKEKGDARQLAWNQTLRAKIKDGQRITFSLEDKADKDNKIFLYDAFSKQFKLTNGNKKFNVVDKNFDPLGTCELNFETQNFVTKEQSSKTEEAKKKQAEDLNQIKIESIKGNFKKDIYDLYFKICSGENQIKTIPIDKAPKDFSLDINQTLYAEPNQNKILFAAFDEEMTKDTFKGSGELLLDKLADGKNTVKMNDSQNNHIGDIIVNAKSKTVPAKQLVISGIKVDVKKSADVVGDPQMYVIGQVAGSTRRTETTSGKSATFEKYLNFKYADEKQMVIKVMDEDVTKHDVVHEVKVNLEELKDKGEMKIPLIPENHKDEKDKHGELSFKYENKLSEKAKAAIKKEEPAPTKKKEQPKKQQPKKQETKKEEPKKEEPKKEEPKKQQKVERKPIINERKLQQSIVDKQKSIDKSRSIDKSKMEKSRNTIKLPDINDPRNWGDKIFEKQSSATLQNSIHAYSLPKANRFSGGPKYSGEPTYVTDSCFKTTSGKGAGFGFGHKRQFPDWMERNMKENPAPGSYFDQHSTAVDFRPKGPTFGLPYKYYEKVMIPREKVNIPRAERKSPQKITKKN